MTIAWMVVKIAIYTFVLVVLYRQSYNFLFFLARRPKTWIVLVGVLGIVNMGLAFVAGWDPRIASVATLAAFVLNIAPSPPSGYTKEEMRVKVNEIYEELGLPFGRLQSRLGLAAFGSSSLVSYVVFVTEACNEQHECTPLIRQLTSA